MSISTPQLVTARLHVALHSLNPIRKQKSGRDLQGAKPGQEDGAAWSSLRQGSLSVPLFHAFIPTLHPQPSAVWMVMSLLEQVPHL